jgi:hypothetical protein
MNKTMRATLLVALMLLLVLAALMAWKRPDRALRVATANVTQTLCAEVFVSGLAPDRAFAENIEPLRGMRILLPHPALRGGHGAAQGDGQLARSICQPIDLVSGLRLCVADHDT